MDKTITAARSEEKFMYTQPPVQITPPQLSLVPPLAAARSNSFHYLIVILLMAFIGLTSVVAVTLFHPGDNTQIDVMIIGFTTTTIGVIIMYLKGDQGVQATAEVHYLTNSNLARQFSQLETAFSAGITAAHARGTLEGRSAAISELVPHLPLTALETAVGASAMQSAMTAPKPLEGAPR